MKRPNRAVVAGYGMAALGIVTMMQYSGSIVTAQLLLTNAGVASAAMVILGGLLIALGIAVATHPDEMHRGTDRAPNWMIGSAVFETVALTAVIGSGLL
ncbi:hypothetical protein [Haloplanus sp.]|uniref:hypothetical protein n=1 Tax=Haloplanus sp. TaxID=1961696 RepID=UPI00262D50BE|nr:hypothetical protein [Haloplanus sp.]